MHNLPSPKPDGEAVNRNPRVHERMHLEWDGEVRGPDLPIVKGNRWCRRTKKWWEMWRRSPQSMIMTDSDWEVMLEAALIHNIFWTGKKTVREKVGAVWTTTTTLLTPSERASLSAELRRKLSAYGNTYEDRAKLRISIKSPQTDVTEEKQIQKDAAKAVGYAERLAQEAANKT